MKAAIKRFIVVASDRKYRPVEVWAFRIVTAYVAIKLGIKATQ